jgi:hypothetical protein
VTYPSFFIVEITWILKSASQPRKEVSPSRVVGVTCGRSLHERDTARDRWSFGRLQLGRAQT